MGPEDEEVFGITPGKIFLVPACADAIEEVQEIVWAVPRTGMSVDWGQQDGWGDDEGPDGGLGGGLHGALGQDGLKNWSVEMTLEPGQMPEEVAALLMGYTLEEWRDLVQWAHESAWLQRVTGLNWGHFE